MQTLKELAIVLIAAMALACILGFAAREARAEDVYRGLDPHGRPMSIRLHAAPCPASVTRWLPTRVRPEFHQAFQAAPLYWEGRNWEACWLEIGGDVYVIDEEGVVLNQGAGMPRRLFRDPAI